MAFHLKKTMKDIIMTEEDREDFDKIKNCLFVRKILKLTKLEIIVTYR